ncbi:tyrosine-type recombinase/integrase [Petroclostridium sp. X23]|uniref:site-specific integrase n=1 Tax=Petroclostridium sp. X23 TaxID=3045146 RepID=UPI0024ACFBC2|nr:tyrosine-type recombinase/integrase [Petroclostridium sp. X23]WHH57199.1 tyrosine-type recombinase/integrase [Petroclostridium sp. X23]
MDGSIQERLNAKSKKVYDVMYRVLDLKTGKKKQRIKRGFTKKGDAQKFLNEVLGQIENNNYVDAKKITLRELMNEWYSKFVEGRLAENTIRGYKVNIQKHINPNIGWIPLQQLTTRNIQNFYDDILKDEDDEESTGLSAKTIIYIHRNLSKALDWAVKDRLILRNPAKDVELPSVKKYLGNVYDQKTIMKLLASVKDTTMELPIALAGLSGLRRGEVAGLKWSDCDFDQGIISIRKQRTGSKNSTKRSEVKTIDSLRCIRITQTLLDILKRHKELQDKQKDLLDDEYHDNGFICCEEDGSIIPPSNFSKRFESIIKHQGIEPIRFHDMRHSFATNMIRLGVPINTVSKMLGHSSVTITLDIYSHVMDEMQVEAVEKLDADIEKYMSKTTIYANDSNNNMIKEEALLYFVA